MHRAIADWLTGHPWRAAIASAICGSLAQALPLPFLLMAGAIPVLVALRFDLRYAFAMATTAAAACSWVVLSTFQPGGWLLVAVGPLFFGPVLLGWLLRRTGSLNLVFQVLLLGTMVLVTTVYLSLEDPVGMWRKPIEIVLTSAGFSVERDRALIEASSRTMWGAVAALTLCMVFSATLLGRWWQSLLDSPGSFGVEYQQLRLGRAMGIATTVLFIVALLSESPLIASLVSVAVMALAFQGLAAAHRSKAVGRLDRNWLVAIYVLLIVLPVTSFAVFMLAIWGFADNWLRPRVRNGTSAV